MGVGVGGGRRRSRCRCCLPVEVAQGQGGLLQCEAVDIGIENREGVGGHLDRESRASKASQDSIVMLQGGGSGRGPRGHQGDRPRVAPERLAGGFSTVTHRRFPVCSDDRQCNLGEDNVDHAVEELVLVGDVVVQRHRLDADGLAELSHAERPDPALVREGHRRAEHPCAAQGRSRFCRGLGRRCHLLASEG
jgi:hypothetical protein